MLAKLYCLLPAVSVFSLAFSYHLVMITIGWLNLVFSLNERISRLKVTDLLCFRNRPKQVPQAVKYIAPPFPNTKIKPTRAEDIDCLREEPMPQVPAAILGGFFACPLCKYIMPYCHLKEGRAMQHMAGEHRMPFPVFRKANLRFRRVSDEEAADRGLKWTEEKLNEILDASTDDDELLPTPPQEEAGVVEVMDVSDDDFETIELVVLD